MKLKFCKNCKICCTYEPELSKSDLKNIALSLCKFETKRIKGISKFKSKRCPFLSKNGCKLPYEQRPLDCRIYPMTFQLENSRIKFYFDSACPHINKLKKSQISGTKKEILQSLKEWSKQEIRVYSRGNQRKMGLYSIAHH